MVFNGVVSRGFHVEKFVL